MAQNNYFSHENLNGQDPTVRASIKGYECSKDYGSYYTEGIVENIAITPIGNVMGCGSVYSNDEIARCTVSGWMESPGHRENILTSTYDIQGIGIAISKDNRIYVTEDFC
ncbi:MAG: hypothetical protein RL557_326 [archaeon]|jgi:uncharacterized protein YkwD